MTALVRIAVAAVALIATVVAPATAAPVAMSVAPQIVSTDLGREFTVRSTIRNDDPSRAAALIAHLTVFSVRDGTYVDPEDWSSDRTRYLKPIPPGGATTILWRMKAVNGGTFAASILAVPADTTAAQAPLTAPPVRIEIAERKTLNAGGILFLSIGLPGALGLVAAGLRLRRRQPHPRRTAPS